MSWKLTKKLKETHLAPLANTFSRSSSQTALTPDVPAKSSSATSTSGTPTPLSQSTTAPSSNGADAQGIAASEILLSPPVAPARPGILILTLQEGRGFSLPPGAEAAFQSRPSHGSSMSAGSFAGSYMGNSARPGSAQMQQSYRPSSAAGGGINAVPSSHGRYSSKYLPYALVDFDKQQVFVNAVSGSPENPVWAGESTQYKFDVSRTTELNLSLYIRNPSAPPNAGRQQDIFIGTCRVAPSFSEDAQSGASQPPSSSDSKTSKKDKTGSVPPPASNGTSAGMQWHDVQYGTGAIRIGVKFVENRQRSLKIEDFDLLKVVGKGSFGKVMQVMKKDTQRIYALKTIRKQHIISRSEVAHTLAERSVLAQINNPFIVPLKFSFQSPEKLYLVLAFVNGGELFHHLQREQRFDINRSRFYAAELLCALECLHGFGVIYRDLKPENILVDYVGHIALCDFGLCKLDMKDEDKTNTFCGTPEYLAPELLHGQGYTKAVDWWTLGVLLYEMLTGLPPFYDENTNEMYRKILAEPLHFPGPEIVPPAARDLLTRLLDRDATRRLGSNGAAEIKAHPFFHSIDWRKLLDRKYEPSFKPSVMDERDTANFDKEFTSEAPTDSYVDGPMLSQTMQQQFAGWSYNRPVEGLGDAGGSIVQGNAFDQR
ncbi:Serine/threonine-protein kinase [Friedmanniomyces endolithicus]|uniref:non-specific serine/threonine protein kinase n=1 Tax=Friedmanniomyces endolithicus TaxID=329885 RepID=A0AAN6HCR5_9PEZI|nr:Serine/threonine-protein kinase [Friedmanniomyces endolithicus]KAK0793805.1 Serine/threonine-protein kinase [Friedmanniomyces endolithicus]KAK0806805.1 Serine/threonine-protein kinase [Friedmanniomyces endolithicus]KAK0857641.1 Serine/threonine-protein kinase [Friedmanniomyces endolithicus]KAK0858155.1 Serine/threonine-protein kinase [Friedmanniomyces endolithicus]